MTNQPPPMPYSAAPTTPPSSASHQAARPRGRGPWIAGAAILAVAALALGIFGVVSSSAASDARAERDDLRRDLLDVDTELETAESDLAAAEQSLIDTEDALTTAQDAADTLQDENDDLAEDLTAAQDAIVENANPFATQEQLDGFRVLLAESRTLLTTAETSDELAPFFFTFDSDFNELIALNVTSDLSECKTILANNGFATTILLASSIAALLEFEPDLLEEAQAEIVAGDPIAESVFDQACGPLPDS